MSIESHEIYPNPPLRLVAFEVRYPLATKLASRETLEGFIELLQDRLPDVELGIQAGFAFNPQQGFAELPTQPLLRLFSRGRRTSVTLGQTSLTVETAEYSKYADFRGLLHQALSALAESSRIGGMSRVGLRYVNEVRVPEVLTPRDWRNLIADTLIAPVSLCGLSATDYQLRLQFDVGDGRVVQVMAGTGDGEFVSSTGPLRVEPARGPFFLVDVDSFSQFDSLRDFVVEETVTICDQLRDPVRKIFDAAITERLKDEVLRVEPRHPASMLTQEVN